ncbi:MAG TPA: PH domain-containing protein [Candidatus Acidoferrales bacterium]|nr:PH domain-containing protein [Candidatus Acidoferrales bacterium]
MNVPEKYLKRIQDFLLPDEKVMIAAAETRLWPCGSLFAPVLIVATNKRIIISRRDVLSISKRYKIISYGDVLDVNVRHGIRYSSIHFGIASRSVESEDTWTRGLRYADMVELAKYVNQMAIAADEGRHRQQTDSTPMQMK